MSRIRVAVVESHEIFRRGTIACLRDDGAMDVVFDGASGGPPLDLAAEVAVVSERAAASARMPCPVVVCTRNSRLSPRVHERNTVLGVLPRSGLTGEQLVATVRAAAAGLRVQPQSVRTAQPDLLDDRSVEVLRLLSRGADTQTISKSLCYSERTVKGLIAEIEHRLGARNRAHAVAEGIWGGLI